MVSKWNGKQCPLCFEGNLCDGKQKQRLTYRGHLYEYVANGAFCNHCHDGFPEHDVKEEAAWRAFRDEVDAKEMAELARIRKKLKLTQQEAAKLAGGGKNAFSRYERGQAKPVAAVVNLFRLLDRHPDLLRELEFKT
ncbi:MAG: type II toxin-antitoxin system MqsA family antitoxin [Sterolibacterium sp.]|jgi:HTH-type transcriptional regulator/antitoxin MqsA|nr:type II toxin-antitoxin system MqsA family antitoxin [Sterolibacterium sp.]